jgi:hypothetical protein
MRAFQETLRFREKFHVRNGCAIRKSSLAFPRGRDRRHGGIKQLASDDLITTLV